MNYSIKTTLGAKSLCTSVHQASGATASTNLTGTSFAPAELLSASLCSCMLSMLEYKANSKGINVEGAYAVATPKDEDFTIKSIAVQIYVPLPGTTEARQMLETATEHCPVHKALDQAVTITTEWHWL